MNDYRVAVIYSLFFIITSTICSGTLNRAGPQFTFPTLFEQWCGSYYFPQEPDKWKCCERGPIVFRPYPRLYIRWRLSGLTPDIVADHEMKASTSQASKKCKGRWMAQKRKTFSEHYKRDGGACGSPSRFLHMFLLPHSVIYTVNCCLLEALRLYIFVRGFRRTYKWRGLYPRGIITRIEKVVRNKI